MDLKTFHADTMARFDRLETKVDSHLERISQTEIEVSWLKGHVKLATTVFIAVSGAIAAGLAKLLWGL